MKRESLFIPHYRNWTISCADHFIFKLEITESKKVGELVKWMQKNN